MIRSSAGFLEEEQALLAAYSTPGTESHEALQERVPGVDVSSVSSAIRALVLVGHQSLAEERLRRAYDAAIEAGEFDDESRDWYSATDASIVALWPND
jgi:hypothetical protein